MALSGAPPMPRDSDRHTWLMGAGLRLLRIRGIQIGIHWSWLVVVALISWTFATGVFPAEVKGLSHGEYVAMGVAAALSYFAGLLLHELGHALQAQREGMA